MQAERNFRPTRIWILRHGRSTLNQAQCFQGCGADSVLTEHGMRSAQLAGHHLAGEKIDAIYSSPLARATQTSALVREELSGYKVNPDFRIEPALQEIELPGWEGLTYDAVRQQFPDSFRQFRHAPASFMHSDPDGTQIWPIQRMGQRVGALMPQLISQHPGRTILLVTHGGPARIMLLAALGLDLSRFYCVQQSHGGLSCITASNWPDQIRLDVLNETHHTGEILPKLKDGKTGVRLLMIANDITRTNITREVEDLAHLLESLPIHRVLAAGTEGVVTAMRVLRYRSRATIETCAEAGLCGAFEGQLQKQHPEKIMNVLITGSAELLSCLLSRLMQSSDAENPMSLRLRSGLSIIHIPDPAHQPVLQAVNTRQAGWTLAGGIA